MYVSFPEGQLCLRMMLSTILARFHPQGSNQCRVSLPRYSALPVSHERQLEQQPSGRKKSLKTQICFPVYIGFSIEESGALDPREAKRNSRSEWHALA